MGKAIPTVRQLHHAVGYWGYGNQAALEDRLTRVAGSSPHEQTRRSGQVSSHATQPYVWGIVDLGLLPVDRPQWSAGTIAALTASGQCQPADGISPDAWVVMEGDRVTFGREPFGRLPLYWTQVEQVLWFASRLSLLLPVIETPQLSLPALCGYSYFSYVPTPLTPIAQIQAVPAGVEQTWIADQGQLSRLKETRSLEWQEAPAPIEDETIAVDRLRSLLKDAVARQVADLGDEPVGVLLSGGLDSSIVAALLVEAGVKVRAYTLDFGTEGIPEYPYAEQVAAYLNIPLVKVDASPRRVRAALIPAAQALDMPFGDGVTVPLFLLMQAASQEVAIVFNGEGGDQLFAGWTNKPLIAAELYQTVQAAGEPFEQQYLRTFHRLWGYEAQIFQPAVWAQLRSLDPQIWLHEALNPNCTHTLLHRLRRANLMLKGAQNIHPRATNLGLAHGLQVRSPFCDLPLAEWSFQLSGALHLQAACEKYILKRAVEPWLPPDIVWRQKRGMGVPLTAWCLDGLWHELGTWLNPNHLRHDGIWQPHVATQIAAGNVGTLQGRRIGESLWLLLMWQVWQHAILGTTRPSTSLDHPFWLPAVLGRQYLRLQRDRS